MHSMEPRARRFMLHGACRPNRRRRWAGTVWSTVPPGPTTKLCCTHASTDICIYITSIYVRTYVYIYITSVPQYRATLHWGRAPPGPMRAAPPHGIVAESQYSGDPRVLRSTRATLGYPGVLARP
jgi:hypothetical protein